MAAKPHSPMPHDRMTVDGQKKGQHPKVLTDFVNH